MQLTTSRNLINSTYACSSSLSWSFASRALRNIFSAVLQRLIGKECSGINVATRFVNITESCDIQSYRNEREREKVEESPIE